MQVELSREDILEIVQVIDGETESISDHIGSNPCLQGQYDYLCALSSRLYDLVAPDDVNGDV